MVVPFGMNTDIATAAEVRGETRLTNSNLWGLPARGETPTGQHFAPRDQSEEVSIADSLPAQLTKQQPSRTEPQEASRSRQPVGEYRRIEAAYLPPPQPPATGKVDLSAQKILRAHYLPQILSDLQRIQPHCGQPSAAMYADRLLRDMRSLRDSTPTDPFGEVVLALYDALAMDNKWADYEANSFETARQILRKVANKEKLTDQYIEKAVAELEEAGFDTTPFGMSFDPSADDRDPVE
jgi:hypothetical protein